MDKNNKNISNSNNDDSLAQDYSDAWVDSLVRESASNTEDYLEYSETAQAALEQQETLDQNSDNINSQYQGALSDLESNTDNTLRSNLETQAQTGLSPQAAIQKAYSSTEQARKNTASDILEAQQEDSALNQRYRDNLTDSVKLVLGSNPEQIENLFTDAMQTIIDDATVVQNDNGENVLEIIHGDNPITVAPGSSPNDIIQNVFLKSLNYALGDAKGEEDILSDLSDMMDRIDF